MAVAAQKLDAGAQAGAVDPSRTPYGAGACVALSAISYFLVIRFVGLWPISLFAPLPILVLAFTTESWRTAAIASFVVFFVGDLGWWSSESFFLPLPIFLLLYAVQAT